MPTPWDDEFERILRPLLRLHPADAALPSDLDLVAAGLDSLGVVELLFQVEEWYEIRLPDEQVGQHLFTTPGSLWSTISQLRSAPELNG